MAARIREFAWEETPLGPIVQWSGRLKLMVEQLLANPLVSSLLCGPGKVLIYNDTAAKLYGDRHPAALGRPLPETFPEGWATVSLLYARAFAGETVRVADQSLDTRGEGVTSDAFDALLLPVREADGQVAYVHMTGSEVAERTRAEAALRASAAHYRNLFDAIDEGFCTIEVLFDGTGRPADYRFLSVNMAFAQQTGFQDAVGRTARELVPAHEAYWFETFGRIARTGEPERFEHRADALGRWYDVYAFRVGAAEQAQVAVLFKDILARKRTEERIRESEARLTAAFEGLPLGIGVSDARGRFILLNEEMRRYVPTGPPPSGDAERRPRWRAWHPDGRSVAPQDFPGTRALRGERVVPGMEMLYVDDEGRETWTSVSAVPLFDQDGRVTEQIGVVTNIDASKRAADTLRESEERFAQFAACSSDALWIRDAATLDMEYASPAIAKIYGVPPETILGEARHWAVLIVPEDRDTALRHLEQARRGDAVVHEFRIQRPSDASFRWVRNTDFPLRDARGRVQRIGGIAQDVTEARLATEHTAVLLAELQHRVRNIMAVTCAITESTAERAETVPDYAETLTGRLTTFARIQALLTRAANVGVGIAEIMRDELSVLARHEGQYRLDGPDLVLSPKAAEVLTLAVHELTTNALKYGALASPHGRVTVRWATFENRGTPWLGFDWIEEGAPGRTLPARSGPRRRGFGSALIEERIPYELGGRGKVVIEPDGARCRLEFPLADGDSILETDAPQRETVFGGVLDMAGVFDLSGQRVLVVEDDFYLAKDAARALQGAGAEVLGPCPSEDAARSALEAQRPDAAVVDINLGKGPSFTLAAMLKTSGVPFLFTTGYDPAVVPPEFEGIERLQKPLQLRQVVSAVAKLVSRTD